MPRKFINGTITSGYTLKSNYTSLTITSRGWIDGAYGGGSALTSQYGASISNAGYISGGAGAYDGAAGGAGALLAGGGTLLNTGTITGGPGAWAKYDGGDGGYGVLLAGNGSIDNKGLIVGGDGGRGNVNFAGRGGAGVALTGAGTVNNFGKIEGGVAGSGGGSYPGYYSGVGVSLSFGGLIVNSGLIAAGGKYAVGVSIKDGGTVNNTGSIVGDAGILMRNGGTIDNSGMISGSGPAGYSYHGSGIYALAADGAAIVTNLGTIIGDSEPIPVGNREIAAVDLRGVGIFTNGAGALAQGYNGVAGSATVVNYGVIDGVERYGVIGEEYVINRAGGLIEGGVRGVRLFQSTITNFGTIAGAEAAAYLEGGRLIAEVGSTFIGGVQGGGGALELASGTETITGLGGAGAISGGLAMTFSGFGTYQLDAGGHVTLRGTNTLGIGKALVDDGALSVAGTLNQLGRVIVGNGEASANLTVLPSRVWNLDGALVYGGAAGGCRITIFGTLANTAGLSEVGVAIHDNGVISVAAGILDLSGSVWGTGSLSIGPGAMLEADSVVGGGLTVDFKGVSATLALSEPKGFAAAIQGLATGDTIDLINLKATGASVNAGDQLVIVDGATTVAALQLKGSYSGATFSVGSDGKGGTDITLTKASGNPPQAFVAAMAAMGAAPGPSSAPQSHAAAWAPALLTPRI